MPVRAIRTSPPRPSGRLGRVAGRLSGSPVLLELDLSRGLLETGPADPVAAVRRRGVPTLRGVVDALQRASRDQDVAGLVAHVSAESLTPSQADELGAAVEAFGATGRVTAAYTESFGELGAGTTSYRLAASFGEIWMQPSGQLGVVGVALYGLFVRGLLDRYGVQPQLAQRHEYKSAADMFMRTSMSDAARESLQRVADSMLETLIEHVARRRALRPEQVRAAVDAAPLSAQLALEAGLVDRLGYRDEVYADLRERLGDDGRLTLRFVQRWAPSGAPALLRRVREHRRPVVGVVSVLGGIVLGRGGGPPVGGPRAGSDSVTAALRQAGRRDDVAAVVLRVVSPGGSYVASDAIRRAVLRLRADGRPVVASMGSVAASGGYFVAMPCDEVVATPSTVTGSIGVLAGKLAVGQALGRVGVGVESVAAGRQSTMFGADRPFDADQLRRLDSWLDEVYDDFTRKAATDRAMPHEVLEPLARGRVWTGADAVERGLVDQLGGLTTAVRAAAGRAGLDPDRVRTKPVPHVGPVERLRPATSSEAPTAALPLGAAAGGPPRGAGVSGLSGLYGLSALSGMEALLAEVVGAPLGVLSLPGRW